MNKKAKPVTQAKATSQAKRPLTPKQKKFVAEYLVDLNGTQAAVRAGYSKRTANEQAARLLVNVNVSAAVSAAQAELSKRTEITQEMVLQRMWDIATADPNQLMQHRRVSCRFCHGKGHAYQWINEAEHQRACDDEIAQARKDDRPAFPPSKAGGFGYTTANKPHPDCPNCFGDGHSHVHFNDTRDLKGPAALLYAGAKLTKDGLELKTQDQGKALENVARHLGMFKEKVELTGPDGGPIEINDTERAAKIKALLAAAAARVDKDEQNDAE